MRLGALEIILIVVLALVVFGGSKLSGVGKALGQSIREFKDELGSDKDEDKDDKSTPSDDNTAATATSEGDKSEQA